METVFRLAVMEDLPALVLLETQCFNTDRLSRRSLRWMIGHAHGQLLVAENQGQLLGYALLLFRRGSLSARLYSLAIASEARGTGLGKRLLQHIEACAVELGCTSLRLEVRTDNVGAMALYERHGYRRFGLIPAFYEDLTDAVRMKKCLVNACTKLI